MLPDLPDVVNGTLLATVLRLDLASVGAFSFLAAVAAAPLDAGLVTIVVAAIAAIVSLGTAAMTMVVLLRTGKIAAKTAEVAKSVDGMKTDLVKASIGQAAAEGQLAGEQAQRDRAATPTAEGHT